MAQAVRPPSLDSPPGSTEDTRPRVYVIGGRAFMYDAASAASLLSEHRIWATPVGVRRAGSKSSEHNFPCVLTQEQTTLILRRNLADVRLGHPPGADGESPATAPYLPNLAFDDDGGTGAAKAAACGAAGSPSSAKSVTATRGGIEWSFPRTLEEKKSMTVFEDLWAKGLCVAGGSNFGADYVVYDGPPTERHSAAAVLVSRGPHDELSPSEVSAFARVQQAVAKTAIIATAPASANLQPEATATSACDSDLVAAASEPSSGDRVVETDGVEYVTLRFHSVSSRT
ncbi:unnamed protein product [Ascophyllum nodosum]